MRKRPSKIKKGMVCWLLMILFLLPTTVVATQEMKTIPYAKTKTQTIGVIGGVSWVSSAEYYYFLNQMVQERLGALESANILMYSIEFGEFSQQERLAEKGNWAPLRETMQDAARRLKNGGAEFIIIASNTMNSSAEDIEQNVGISVLHIADATAEKIVQSKIKRVALLGTSYTMEAPFYRERLEKKGIEVVVPTAKEREYINKIIFDELCANKILPEARKEFIKIIDRLIKDEKVQGVVLGCTEIPLLVKQKDVKIPVFDTTKIHCEAAVKRSLGLK